MYMTSLIEIGEKFVKRAKEFNADEIELFIVREERTRVEFVGEDILTTSGISEHVAVRVVVGKSLGFSSVSSLRESEIENAIKIAVKIAKEKPADPHFKHLPDPEKPIVSKSPFDERILSVSPEIVGKYVSEALNSAYSTSKYLKKMEGTVSLYSVNKVVVNSRGICEEDSGTFFTSWIWAMLKKNDEISQEMRVLTSRMLELESLPELFRTTVKRGEEYFGKKKLPSDFKHGPVIFENVVVPSIFATTLLFNLSARNVQEKRSVWMNKLGQQVASRKFTLIDDGTMANGFYTFRVDDEGVPMRRKVVIENGVLKTFLYDSYAALRENKKSTGNALRPSPTSEPQVTFTNVIIEGEKGSIDDLIREVDKGLLIRSYVMGSHLVDPVRGILSVTCPMAFYIEHGEIQYPLKSVIVSINIFEALNNIVRIGKDYVSYVNFFVPSMLISGLSFT